MKINETSWGGMVRRSSSEKQVRKEDMSDFQWYLRNITWVDMGSSKYLYAKFDFPYSEYHQDGCSLNEIIEIQKQLPKDVHIMTRSNLNFLKSHRTQFREINTDISWGCSAMCPDHNEKIYFSAREKKYQWSNFIVAHKIDYPLEDYCVSTDIDLYNSKTGEHQFFKTPKNILTVNMKSGRNTLYMFTQKCLGFKLVKDKKINESVLNETSWGGMVRRSSSEKGIRKEDELDEETIGDISSYAAMFGRSVLMNGCEEYNNTPECFVDYLKPLGVDKSGTHKINAPLIPVRNFVNNNWTKGENLFDIIKEYLEDELKKKTDAAIKAIDEISFCRYSKLTRHNWYNMSIKYFNEILKSYNYTIFTAYKKDMVEEYLKLHWKDISMTISDNTKKMVKYFESKGFKIDGDKTYFNIFDEWFNSLSENERYELLEPYWESYYMENGSRDDGDDIDLLDEYLHWKDYADIYEVGHKSITETSWGGMVRRSSSDVVRIEDELSIDKVEFVKKQYIHIYAYNLGYYDKNDVVNPDVDDACKFIKDHFSRGEKYMDDVISHIKRNWKKGENYFELIRNMVNDARVEVFKTGFKKNHNESIADTLYNWWNSFEDYGDKADMLVTHDVDINTDDDEEAIDAKWDDLPWSKSLEIYNAYNGQHNLNETSWGGMVRRSSSEKQVRKEDELDDVNKRALDKYIEHYTDKDSFDGYATRKEYTIRKEGDDILYYFTWYIRKYSDLLRYMKEYEGYKISTIIDYVKNNWDKGVNIKKRIEDMYSKNTLNETSWGGMVRRSSGEIKREEDKLSDDDRKCLDKYIEMFAELCTDNEYGGYEHCMTDFLCFIKDFANNVHIERLNPNVKAIYDYVKDNWENGENIMDKIDKCIEKIENEIDECDAVAPNGGLTFNDVSGMGPILFPGECGEKGSGDLPMPSGKIYKQVAPFDSFIKKRKKKKKFRKEDEPCAKYSNPDVYKHVDDFREYVDRTYNKIK